MVGARFLLVNTRKSHEPSSAMKKSQWNEIQRIFDAALDLPEGERRAFANREASDPEVAEEVGGLLDSHAGDGKLSRMDRTSTAEETVGAAPTSPEQIGPYHILRRLGSGGMGTVYLAERSDGQYEHRVALKLMREDPSLSSLRPRFLAERQILAQLVHPNIAWLLDGNVTQDGRPYFVMEYVEGHGLLEYCDSRRLGLRRRLELFLDVCDAVSYAHQNLIVHRDLKPSNVLVTEDGRVKLMDFGIAKLLDSEPGKAGSEPLTRASPAPMTPEYAAPEQLQGDPITTATDVYQLGGLLYQVLTGRRPFDGVQYAGPISNAVLSVEPSKPSTAVGTDTADGRAANDIADVRGSTVRKLAKELTGDLDQVILKALRKEPEERFRSVGDFADDLRRYLDGRPVQARRATLHYRASRFVRRNKFATIAGAAALVALIGGTFGTATQAARASREAAVAAQARDLAQTEALHAQEITDFLVGLFDVASGNAVRPDTLRLLPVLEEGVRQLQASDDLEAPIRRRLLGAVSTLYRQMGRMDEAERIAAEEVDVAVAIAEEDPGAVPEAMLHLSGIYYQRGKVASSDSLTQLALERYEGLAAANPGDTALAARVARTRLDLGHTKWQLLAMEEAEALSRESVEYHRSSGNNSELARALDLYGAVLFNTGRAEESLAPRQESLDVRRRVLPAGDSDITRSMGNLATTLMATGRLEAAERLQRESLAMRRAQYGDEHPAVAMGLHSLAWVHRDMERYDEAIEGFEEALAMKRRTLGPDNRQVAVTLSMYARMLTDQLGRCQEGLPLLQEAVPMWARSVGPKHGEVFRNQASVGNCLSVLGRFDEAEAELLEAYAGLAEVAGSNHGETKRARAYLASLYERWGKPDEAAQYLPEPGSP